MSGPTLIYSALGQLHAHFRVTENKAENDVICFSGWPQSRLPGKSILVSITLMVSFLYLVPGVLWTLTHSPFYRPSSIRVVLNAYA